MADLWHEAMDDVYALHEELKAAGGGTLAERIALAQVKATLSVSQEISDFNPSNTYGFNDAGQKINAWGLPMH